MVRTRGQGKTEDDIKTPTGRARQASRRKRAKSSPPSEVGVPSELVKPGGFEEAAGSEDSASVNETNEVSSLDDTSSEEKDEHSVATPILSKAKKKKTPATKSKLKTPSSASSTRSVHPARTNASGLSLVVQADLAEAIEAAGGRDQFFEKDPLALKQLRESNPSVFGEAQSPRYTSVKGKVRRWRELTLEEYHAAIKSLGITPAGDRFESLLELRNKQKSPEKVISEVAAARPAKTSTTKLKTRDVQLPSSFYTGKQGPRPPGQTSPSAAATKKKSAAAATKKKSKEPKTQEPKTTQYRDIDDGLTSSEEDTPKKQLFRSKTATPTSKKMPTTSSTAGSKSSGFSEAQRAEMKAEAKDAVTIEVDLDYPERNEIVEIVPFETFEYGGKDHEGYDITFQGDYRHYHSGMYKMSLHGKEGNIILFQKPSRASIFDAVGSNGKQYEAQEEIAVVKKGHAINNESYSEDPSRHTAKYLLEFPDGMSLTHDPFRTGTTAGEKYFEGEMHMIRFKTGQKDKKGKELIGLDARVSFKVINLTSGKRHKGSKNPAADKLAAKIAALDLDELLAERGKQQPSSKKNVPQKMQVSPQTSKQPGTSNQTSNMWNPAPAAAALPPPTKPPPVAASSLQRHLLPTSPVPIQQHQAQTISRPRSPAPETFRSPKKYEPVDRKEMFKSQPNNRESRETAGELRRINKKNMQLQKARTETVSPAPTQQGGVFDRPLDSLTANSDDEGLRLSGAPAEDSEFGQHLDTLAAGFQDDVNDGLNLLGEMQGQAQASASQHDGNQVADAFIQRQPSHDAADASEEGMDMSTSMGSSFDEDNGGGDFEFTTNGDGNY